LPSSGAFGITRVHAGGAGGAGITGGGDGAGAGSPRQAATASAAITNLPAPRPRGLLEAVNDKRPWPSTAARYLNQAESAVLILIGAVLVVLAVLLLWSSATAMIDAMRDNNIPHQAIEILNSVLLVMMTMEIVYTVAISLESHTLVAEPFLIIGTIAAIRRMLVITATSTETEHTADVFHNTLIELGLLAGTVIALSVAIWVLRHSQTLKKPPSDH
jgi:phosphate starvation-inducible membrane PsiE